MLGPPGLDEVADGARRGVTGVVPTRERGDHHRRPERRPRGPLDVLHRAHATGRATHLVWLSGRSRAGGERGASGPRRRGPPRGPTARAATLAGDRTDRRSGAGTRPCDPAAPTPS